MLPITPIALALIILKVAVITVAVSIVFYVLETYIHRRRARNEGLFRDHRRENNWWR